MITAENLKQINEKLEGIPVKGKNYVEVNTRVKAFRELCPEGMISTEIIEMADGVVTIKATIATEEGRIVSTGLAQEKESSSFINKTSYIENCETSAVGRALGFLGIGIDGSMCSADELATALNNQNKKPTTDKEMDDHLSQKISAQDVKLIKGMVEGKAGVGNWILEQCGVKKFEDMTNKQYGEAMRALNEYFEKQGK